MTKSELKDYLDFKVELYNNTSFIKDDPIAIPHQFTEKKDIEIIAFIIATIAWGKRNMILRNGELLLDIMGYSPHSFIMNAGKDDLADLRFVHRTFNELDLKFFFEALKAIYNRHANGLEGAFLDGHDTANRIANFRNEFLSTPHEKRSEKHISNPLSGSASKRINMFLRWMVRSDKKGVDFGIWHEFGMENLYVPLDVHTGNVARKLGIIQRKANDWKALEEMMILLREFDPKDPSKYDFALFGVGVNKEI